MTDPDPTPDAKKTAQANPAQLPRMSFDSLCAGKTEILITHGDAVYRLRQTSLGKLILTK
ncbi:MAG: hemin uptake protein HemP [Anderseniella sp.]